MSQFKFILIGIASFIVVGCTAFNEPGTKVSQAGLSATNTPATQENNNVAQASNQVNNKVINSKGTLKEWEFTVTSIKSEAQTFNGKYDTYEAVDAWTVISVNVKNVSGKRQSQVEGGVYLQQAELIDSNGNKYRVEKWEPNYSVRLLDKPFSVGEARSSDLLFDTPNGIKAQHLVIESYDSSFEKNSISIKLSD